MILRFFNKGGMYSPPAPSLLRNEGVSFRSGLCPKSFFVGSSHLVAAAERGAGG